MIGKLDILLRRVYDALGANLQGRFEKRDDFCGRARELVGEFLVVGY